MYKDRNPTHGCWYSPASDSKARKQQLGRWLKFLNLPKDYELISYHPTELNTQDFLSLVQPLSADGVKGKMLLFSPTSPAGTEIFNTLRNRLEASTALPFTTANEHQPCTSAVLKHREIPFSPSLLCPLALPIHLLGLWLTSVTVMGCCHRAGQHRTAPNRVLPRAAETSTNNRSPSRAGDLSEWSAHFQS